MEQAKAAAQADYEKRLLIANPALDPATVLALCALAQEALQSRREGQQMREALHDMIEAFQPFTSKPMGAPGSSARQEQETQVRVHAAARRALNGGTSDAD